MTWRLTRLGRKLRLVKPNYESERLAVAVTPMRSQAVRCSDYAKLRVNRRLRRMICDPTAVTSEIVVCPNGQRRLVGRPKRQHQEAS